MRLFLLFCFGLSTMALAEALPYRIGPSWEERLANFYVPHGLAYDPGSIRSRLAGLVGGAAVESGAFDEYLVVTNSLPDEAVEEIASRCAPTVRSRPYLVTVSCVARAVHDFVIGNYDFDSTGMATDGSSRTACQAHSRGIVQVLARLQLDGLAAGYKVLMGSRYNHVVNVLWGAGASPYQAYVLDATTDISSIVFYPR